MNVKCISSVYLNNEEKDNFFLNSENQREVEIYIISHIHIYVIEFIYSNHLYSNISYIIR